MVDAFQARLEELVRRTAEQLAQDVTALILERLGIGAPVATLAAARTTKRRAPAQGREPTRVVSSGPIKKRGRAPSTDRAEHLQAVERVVAASQGVGLGQIEKETGLSRATISSALRALKDEGRIHMGGNRRFARYASTQALADQASRAARGA